MGEKNRNGNRGAAGALCIYGGRTFEIIQNTLEKELGDQVFRKVIDGQARVPQHRERIYMAGLKTPFVHGCYWHRHEGCKYACTPKSNMEFWLTKFETNKKRDALVYKILLDSGLRILIVWECTVRTMKSDVEFHQETLRKIEDFIRSENQSFLEI